MRYRRHIRGSILHTRAVTWVANWDQWLVRGNSLVIGDCSVTRPTSLDPSVIKANKMRTSDFICRVSNCTTDDYWWLVCQRIKFYLHFFQFGGLIFYVRLYLIVHLFFQYFIKWQLIYYPGYYGTNLKVISHGGKSYMQLAKINELNRFINILRKKMFFLILQLLSKNINDFLSIYLLSFVVPISATLISFLARTRI